MTQFSCNASSPKSNDNSAPDDLGAVLVSVDINGRVAMEELFEPLTFSSEPGLSVFRCLYCDREKPASASSLEHAVPQFLGGAQAPPSYKLRNVCVQCNNVLGLHVDASYARSWHVTNALAIAARKLYTGPGQIPLPLSCIGVIQDMPGLVVPEGMAAEYWAGPSGENIIWIRSDNDVMYWYSGGHPIEKKTKSSTLFYLPTASDELRFRMGMEAFNEFFKKAKVRRIFGAKIANTSEDMIFPGFHAPTGEEVTNLEAIRRASHAGSINIQARVNTRFDGRFICKMVLAVGYSIFGTPFLETDIAKHARIGLWPNQSQKSLLRGIGSFGGTDTLLAHFTGYPGAVAIMVMRVGARYAMIVSIDQQMPFITELAPGTLISSKINDDGYALLMFPQLRQSLELELPEMLAHKLGNIVCTKLAEVDAKAKQAEVFNLSLPPLPTR